MVRSQLRLHLGIIDQLRDLDIVADPYENSPTRASVYNDLVKWTEASKAQMAYGKKKNTVSLRLCTLL